MIKRYYYIFLWRQADSCRYMRRNESIAWGLSRSESTARVLHIELVGIRQVIFWVFEWFTKPKMRSAIWLQLKKTFSLKPICLSETFFAKSILVVKPTNIPVNSKLLVARIQKIINHDEQEGELVVFYYPPSTLSRLSKYLFANIYICDLIDDVPARESSLTRKTLMIQDYHEAIKRADWVISTSENLKRYGDQVGVEVECLPNGVDIQGIQSSFKDKDKQGVTIGYVGSINETMDAEIVLYILEKCPDFNFIFAGFASKKGKSYLKRFGKFSNFMFIGEIPYVKIANFFSCCSILINPKKNNYSVVGNDSLKTYQYIVTGKPVVSTSMSPAKKFKDFVMIGDTPSEFHEKLIHASKVKFTNKELIKRKDFCLAHDWSNKIERIEKKIKMLSA